MRLSYAVIAFAFVAFATTTHTQQQTEQTELIHLGANVFPNNDWGSIELVGFSQNPWTATFMLSKISPGAPSSDNTSFTLVTGQTQVIAASLFPRSLGSSNKGYWEVTIKVVQIRSDGVVAVVKTRKVSKVL